MNPKHCSVPRCFEKIYKFYSFPTLTHIILNKSTKFSAYQLLYNVLSDHKDWTQRETKMSIFSNFVSSDVPKPRPLSLPHIATMFNFVESYRFVINPLTINQNFISISFFVKLLQKTFGGIHSTPLGRARVNIRAVCHLEQQRLDTLRHFSVALDIVIIYYAHFYYLIEKKNLPSLLLLYNF